MSIFKFYLYLFICIIFLYLSACDKTEKENTISEKKSITFLHYFSGSLNGGLSEIAVCEAIIFMAHKLGLKVIAEGIENEDQHVLLKTVNCDYGQGFYYSKPLVFNEFLDFLNDTIKTEKIKYAKQH